MQRFFVIFCVILMVSCARQGNPSGGPKDVTAPRFLSASPDTLATSVPVDISQININFDEYIVLKDLQKQLIISPPIGTTPTILPTAGNPRKNIRITLKDSLQPNTTYSFNFGQSIQDNNEGNTLPFFQYVFSTGPFLDSLSCNGSVINTFKNEIDLSTVVALYEKDTTAFSLSNKANFMSKIDSSGNFTFNYLKSGLYKMVAFTDENYNLTYDEGEWIAFKNDFVPLDSLQHVNFNLSPHIPDYSFGKISQSGTGKLLLEMKGQPDSIQLQPLDMLSQDSITFLHHAYSDSAYVFFPNRLTQSWVSNKKRLSFILQHHTQKDTISILYDRQNTVDLEISPAQTEFTPSNIFALQTNYPIQQMNPEKIKVIEDSISLDFSTKISGRHLDKAEISFPIKHQKSYLITLLPDAIQTLQGANTDSLQYKFSTQSETFYGILNLSISNPPKEPFLIELIQKDKVVLSTYGTQTVFQFSNLKPGDYQMRIRVDSNANGIWDGANISANRQAEPIYYLNKNITIRAFWEINESWSLP